MALSHRGFLGDRLQGKALVNSVCAAASAGFLLLGYDQGVMSGILTEQNFLSYFPLMDPGYKDSAIQALVVAIYEVGCLIGSFIIMFYGDQLGRRRAILVGASIMVVGAILQTTSFQMAQLIVGRIVTGVGNGMNTSTIPVWQSEIAPPHNRGFLVLFEGALITAGIMFSYWLNYGFWFVDQYGSFQWRFPIGFQLFFVALLIIGILALPESPRWLLKHGHEEDAIHILSQLYGEPEDSETVQEDIKEQKAINAETSASNLTLKEFFSNGKGMYRWRATAAFLSQAFQQLTGINLVTYYATTVFERSLGFDGRLSRFLTAWNGTEYFIAAILALFLVDRLGRRKLMMGCAAGMAACLVIIAVTLSTGRKGPAYAATVFFFIYNSFFAVGWLGITWLYPSEVTPLRIRAQAASFSSAANWIFNYAVVQLAPIMIAKIAWKTYFVFFCFNVSFIPVIYFYFPETNGHKLEHMDMIFAEAYSKKENPVKTEKRVRKNGIRSLSVDTRVEEEDVEKVGKEKEGQEEHIERSEE